MIERILKSFLIMLFLCATNPSIETFFLPFGNAAPASPSLFSFSVIRVRKNNDFTARIQSYLEFT